MGAYSPDYIHEVIIMGKKKPRIIDLLNKGHRFVTPGKKSAKWIVERKVRVAFRPSRTVQTGTTTKALAEKYASVYGGKITKVKKRR